MFVWTVSVYMQSTDIDPFLCYQIRSSGVGVENQGNHLLCEWYKTFTKQSTPQYDYHFVDITKLTADGQPLYDDV